MCFPWITQVKSSSNNSARQDSSAKRDETNNALGTELINKSISMIPAQQVQCGHNSKNNMYVCM